VLDLFKIDVLIVEQTNDPLPEYGSIVNHQYGGSSIRRDKNFVSKLTYWVCFNK
jgi:hypothetical protein